MFETIGTIFSIVMWVLAILVFLGGIICCIGDLVDKDIDANVKVFAVIGLILAALVFKWGYNKLESVWWGIFLSGFVLVLFCAPAQKK